MSNSLTAQQLHASFLALCDKIEEQKDYLSDLDGAIGDGDHGVNMAKCFRGVKKVIQDTPDTDTGILFTNIGMEVMNSVGGAMGALFGTFFLRLGTSSKDKPEVTLEDLAAMFNNGLEGILAIGKAQVGDKTLVDTLTPAVESLNKSQSENLTLADALLDFDAAAKAGMESTKELMAKVGRASRLGERTIGHQDAGATSCYYILHTFLEAHSA